MGQIYSILENYFTAYESINELEMYLLQENELNLHFFSIVCVLIIWVLNASLKSPADNADKTGIICKKYNLYQSS
jgi:hypothetical protein